MSEFKDIRDSQKAINGSRLADLFFDLISVSDVDQANISGPFLGLGAGRGLAERNLAARLDIRDITLVDKEDDYIFGFDGSYIKEDLFKYLQDTPDTYGVVSVFGIEFLFEKQKKWKELWSGLSKITKPKAVVFMYPYLKDYPIPSDSEFAIKNNDYLLIAQKE